MSPTRSPHCRISYTDQGGGTGLVRPDRIQMVIDAALREDDLWDQSLGIAFVDIAESARLHKQSHGDPTATDVITWPDGCFDPETQTTRLGDLAICPEIALLAADHDPRRASDEIVLYALHGVLHLLGYDDHQPEDRATMWATQHRLLAQMGMTVPPDGR